MSSGKYIKKVAIVGATGTVGKFIVEEILKLDKHELTAITRADSTTPIPDGVRVAKVDYDDQSTLVQALQGQEVLIITMSVRAPKDTQIKLIEAAAEANVPYVLPNAWGLDTADESLAKETMLGSDHYAAIKKIEELGKSAWIDMITSFWYEYSLSLGPNTYGMDYPSRTFTFFDQGETKINTSTWPQSGRAVAALLSLPIDSHQPGDPCLARYKNRQVYTSSFLVSQKDMFESVLRVSGTKESDWTLNYEDVEKRYQDGKDALLQRGERVGFMKLMYSRCFWRDGSGNYEAKKGLDNDALGLPKEDLDEYTKKAIELAEKGFKYH